MAAHAVRAEAAAVDIVRPVASDAGRLHLHFVGAMTVSAFGVCVRSRQGEFGLGRMIERPIRPGDRVVASLACRAESSLMCVVVAMTIQTDDRCVGIAL